MMSEFTPTPETQRRIDLGEQFMTWIIPRLAGDSDEIETTLVVLLAQMRERYAQGIQDAADLVQRLSSVKPQSRDLAIVSKALAELQAEVKSDPVTKL